MKRFFPAALAALAMLVVAPASVAAIPEKGSISIFAGVGPAIPFEGDYKVGFHLEAGGEYYLSNVLALRGTLGLTRSNADGGSGVTLGGLEASAVYYARRGKWSPYVLAGVGIHTVDPPGRSASQRLSAHVGGGTEYYLDRRTALTGEITGRFIGSAGDRTSSFASLAVGIKYHF
ncbi:MAG TPA: outer membrane beta-barrel protein [Thermoanaerobaculia bacterium]|jgi:hypothetical protein|nr:outer membrane beta-barrel protein [Thermoanaerobaculia bacterium]HPA50055.1 outer membrane beta-barrel protein [Thermoanaerobaculia bacterium]HQN06969.1 outer membrane beta-barrel protein [Thermoanaerobaculia bacterium]HQP87720.1 outer membrane beta-barrel protein [Thermoanaerobaculia bacterium]